MQKKARRSSWNQHSVLQTFDITTQSTSKLQISMNSCSNTCSQTPKTRLILAIFSYSCEPLKLLTTFDPKRRSPLYFSFLGLRKHTRNSTYQFHSSTSSFSCSRRDYKHHQCFHFVHLSSYVTIGLSFWTLPMWLNTYTRKKTMLITQSINHEIAWTWIAMTFTTL